jgi:16S rRNA methyltransferase RsmB/F
MLPTCAHMEPATSAAARVGSALCDPQQHARSCSGVRLSALPADAKSWLQSRERLRARGLASELGAGDGQAGDEEEVWFDRVLLDAPCSGSGVLAKRADLRWRAAAAVPAELVALQARACPRPAARWSTVPQRAVACRLFMLRCLRGDSRRCCLGG